MTCVSLRAAGADKEFKGNSGGNGNASNPDNFTNTNNGNTSNTPPGQNDRVKVDKTLDPITSQEIPLTLVENLTWGSLEFLGGKITGAHLLTLKDATSTWTGGEFSAVTFNLPGLTIGTGSNAKKVSNGAKLNLSGITNWNADTITTGGSSELNNTGTFTANFDGQIAHDNTGSRATFKNDGTFTKSSASSGTTEVEAVFNNNATVNVNAGTLKLSGGGTSASGSSVSISNGATLQLSGNDYAFTGSTLSGAGTIDVAGAITTFNGHSGNANLKVSGGTAKFDSNLTSSGSLTVTSGAVDGLSSATTSVGGFVWNGGDIKTTKVNSSGSATIGAGTAKKLIAGAQLTLGGTTSWDGSTLSTGGSSQLTNQATGNFTVTGDGTIAHDVDGNRATFTNAGTFTKSAGSTGNSTEIQSKFDNTGTVSVGAGKLKLSGGGTSSGTVSVAGTLEVSGTDYAFTGGNLAGAGSIDLLGATTTFNSVTSNTTFKVNGGNARFDGTNVGGGKLELTSGTVSGTGTAEFSSIEWSGGNLNGKLRSTGNTTISGGAKSLGGELTLDGNTTWTGSSITTASNAKIKNEAGRTFTAAGDGMITNGGGVTFTNNGTFTKSTGTTEIQARFDNNGSLQVSGGKLKLTGGGASTGQVTIGGTLEVGGTDYTFGSGAFNNGGLVDIQSGNLAVNGGGNSTGGHFNVAQGARLDFGNNYSLSGGKILGQGRASINGTLFVTGPTASEVGGLFELKKNSAISGNGQLSVSGQLEWLGGDMLSSGVTKIVGGGQLLLSGADSKRVFDNNGAGGRVIENAGLVAMNGIGGLLFGDGASFSNQAGGNFDLRSDAGIGSTGTGNKGAFTNSGTLHKSAGNGVSSIAGIHFTNNSTVWAQSGTLSFDDAVTNNGGTFQASPSASISFNGNHARAFGANSRFVGGGAHVINAGVNAFGGDFTAQNLTFSGGTLTGPATLHGSLAWTGGDWISGSTFTVASDAVLTLDGPGAKRLYHGSANSGGRVLANEGTIILQGAGQLQLGDGAQLTNAKNATLDIRNDGTIGHTGSGNSGAVVNSGTIVKNTSSGTATIAQPFSQSSDGKIVVNSGTLAFTSSFTNNSGGISVAHGAAISFGATFNTGTGALSGTGTIHAANVTAGGLVSPGTSPGTLTLTGDLSLLSTSTLLFELAGSTQGVGYDLLSVGGSASLGGNLSLQFLNGFHTTMAPGSTFTVFTSNGITGNFANVANGQKLLTSDGIGFFQINYGTGSAFGANNIVLSHFTAVPEPSTYVMLGLGAVIVLWQVRRRRR